MLGTAIALVLAVIMGKPDQVQLLQTTTGPEPDKIRTFNEEIERGVRGMYPNLCPSVVGYYFHTGARRGDSPGGEAVFFAVLYRRAEYVAWQIPMRTEDPKVAAQDLLKNLRISLAAAEHCGGIAHLCESAFTQMGVCKELEE